MLRFSGRLGRRGFAIGAAIRIAVFVLLTLAFPLFLYGLAALFNCFASPSQGCNVLGLVGASMYKPTVFVLLLFSFFGISVRRVRDIGLPGWTGLLIPLLLAADWSFLVLLGTSWSFSFTAGVLYVEFPKFAVCALALIGLLAAAPSQEFRAPSRPQLVLAGVTAALAALFAIYALLHGVPGVLRTLTDSAMRPLWRALTLAEQGAPYALAALVGAVAWLAFWPAGGRVASSAEKDQWPGLPIKRLAPLAFVAAVAAVLAVTHSSSWMFGIFAWLVPIVLPTALLYFAVFAALALLLQRRSAGAAALVGITLLPFAHWGYEHFRYGEMRRAEAAEIAAIPREQLTIVPGEIVVEGDNLNVLGILTNYPGVDSVVYLVHGGMQRHWSRRGGYRKPEEVSVLPERYLLLRVGNASQFDRIRVSYDHDGGPFELLQVSPEGERLLGAYYHRSTRPPAPLPIISFSGWLPDNPMGGNPSGIGLGAFLAEVVGPKVPIAVPTAASGL